jgi:sec-independent protein translocase protein TatA
MGPIGIPELIVILFIIILLFGGKKIPEVAKSLGTGIAEFKKALSGKEKADDRSERPQEEKNDGNRLP